MSRSGISKRYLSFRERTARVSAFICVMPAWTRICMHICMHAYARMPAYTRVYVRIYENMTGCICSHIRMALHVQTRVSMRTPREGIYIYGTWIVYIHQSAQPNGIHAHIAHINSAQCTRVYAYIRARASMRTYRT